MEIQAGTRVTSATASGKHGHSLISDAKFRRLYEVALRLRIAGRQQARLRGREAALAGLAADMVASDVVVAEFAASIDDIARGHATLRLDRRSFEERAIEALSGAVGDRMRKTGRITAIFFDAAHPGKIFEEARRMAIDAKLPVLLVESPAAGSARRTPAAKAKRQPALEYPSIPVDTHDVIAMYRVAHESIARAREGNGPTHIVGVRWQVPAGKRTAKAASQDAVAHLEEWLIARGLPAQEWRREIVAEFTANGQAGRIDAHTAAETASDEPTESRAIA